MADYQVTYRGKPIVAYQIIDDVVSLRRLGAFGRQVTVEFHPVARVAVLYPHDDRAGLRGRTPGKR